MRILLDSSVLISFLNQGDIFHKETAIFMENLLANAQTQIIAPTLVFLEIANILYKQIGGFREQTLVEVFNNFEVIDLNYGFAREILSILKNLNLKTSDAIICATAKFTDSTLITWDKRLQQAASKIVKTANPQTFSL